MKNKKNKPIDGNDINIPLPSGRYDFAFINGKKIKLDNEVRVNEKS